MVDIELSPKQEQVLESILDWYKSGGAQVLTMGGYAGTGKTTLIGYLRKMLSKENSKLSVAFCSYTGKATRVLNQKLKEAGAVTSKDSVSTIHSLIYSAITDKDGRVLGWEKKEQDKFTQGLIIVDEASMITQEIWSDLKSYGKPILAVGDHGQLPPIGDKFNIMAEPELKLEEIYRQEAGNPIIRLSMLARREGKIPFGKFGRGVEKISRSDPDTQEFLGDLFRGINDELLVLTGYNHTRVKLNNAIRGLLEYETPKPEVGDRVICLRNNHQHRIYNGMIGTIDQISLEKDNSGPYYDAHVLFDGDQDTFKGQLSVEQFGQNKTIADDRREGIDLFDFGYALTVHKSQGSQADRVVVFEERFSKMDDDMWRRWLYTAVTRARSELYIVG